MKIIDSEECEYCEEIENVTHPFLTCERTLNLWGEITIWLQNVGYLYLRLEQKIILLRDTEKNNVLNLSLMIGKKHIKIKEKDNRTHYYILKRLIEIERKSEEIIYAIQNDKVEMYEKKWEKYINCFYSIEYNCDTVSRIRQENGNTL